MKQKTTHIHQFIEKSVAFNKMNRQAIITGKYDRGYGAGSL